MVAILDVVEAAAANIVSDAFEWSIVKTSAGGVRLVGPFRVGKITRVETFVPVAEVRQIVNIGVDATPEVITASTRYKIEIGNPDDKYESQRRGPAIHAYTSAASLTASAPTDRLNVYTALAAKINAYAGNNVTAYLLTVHDYTAGASTKDQDNYIIGEIVDQGTSSETARVAKCLITSGDFPTENAAGKIWVFDISDTAAWLDTAVALVARDGTGQSDCTVTQTASTQEDGQGIALEDDAGYFISNIARTGMNWVGATQGWTVSVAAIGLVGVYSMGIGATMIQLIPRYDHSKQDVISGFLEYELQNSDVFDAAKTYQKYVITIAEGDEDSMGATVEKSETQVILYFDYADVANFAAFDTALALL